ncbi:Nitroreductase [Daldinia loculata]|uniref:Nitroreductase n=1 Tax=Daldinia loculata TaxID=103429 RepID=UPI0020C57C11|nr:Nitroreductase [Daldinia loculata]KAI1648179.1 Nitroreductase [Daldinia loculata]KAI2781489.1 Nitroreductase [Daldinia loculata]
MRPHIVTSAVLSFSRLSISTSTTSATTPKTSSLALKTLAATCSQRSLFTSSASQCQPPKSQAKTTHTPSARFSTTPKMAAPTKSESFLDLIKNRRTYYALNKELPTSKERIQEIVKQTILEVPSSFNSQSNRVVVLFGADHDKLWDITSEILKTIVPADAWEHTAQRMNGFKAGAGTVLFFEDQEVVNKMQTQFSLYSDKFPIWALQSDAMIQFAIWTAFTAEGLGANLQHYNPLIDAKVASEWGIPDNWQLNAQLVFGGRAGEPGPKDQLPIEDRLKVFGA